MTVTRQSIVAAARGFIGTKFHHQGRAPGVGLDCVGVIVCALRAAGATVEDIEGYGRSPRGELQPACDSRFLRVWHPLPLPGDLILFWVHRRAFPWHVGLCSAPGRMIHASASIGSVREQEMGAKWEGQIHAIYDLSRTAEGVAVG